MNYPANSTVIKLSRPFKIDGTDVTELTMREPTVRDCLLTAKSGKSGVESELAMIINLCGLDEGDLALLPACDFTTLSAAASRFFLPPELRQIID